MQCVFKEEEELAKITTLPSILSQQFYIHNLALTEKAM
jgi:hypothetical protein